MGEQTENIQREFPSTLPVCDRSDPRIVRWTNIQDTTNFNPTPSLQNARLLDNRVTEG